PAPLHFCSWRGVQGNHLEAETLHRKALDMRMRVLGPNHMDVAATLNNLAVSLKGQAGERARIRFLLWAR
ncbi:unnamed protein product, partial [Hapterophycus canaliculatus]